MGLLAPGQEQDTSLDESLMDADPVCSVDLWFEYPNGKREHENCPNAATHHTEVVCPDCAGHGWVFHCDEHVAQLDAGRIHCGLCNKGMLVRA